jgi:DNA-binding transcriptional LysR family regulator
MVRHGAGIACLPSCTVRGEIEAGSLVALKLAADLPALEIRYGHGAPLTAAGRQFVSIIRGVK